MIIIDALTYAIAKTTGKKVDEKEFTERLEICEECPESYYVLRKTEKVLYCKCGCRVCDKANYKETKLYGCPKKKWPIYTTTDEKS